jgi:hypothetical protein
LPERRVRDRVFPVLTLIVAVAWIVASLWIARYVDRLNQERFIAGTMAAGATDDSSGGGSGISSLFRFDPKPPSPQRTDKMARLKEQFGWTQEIVRIWRQIMLGIGGFLICVGVLSVFRGLIRVMHLLAGFAVIGGTMVSVIALNLLVDPEAGGLPPLSRWTPVLIALVQGFYGVVLFIAFARRGRVAATIVADNGCRSGSGAS